MSYQCEHCGYKDTYQNITGHGGKPNHHYATCLEFPLKCINYDCGIGGIKRKDIEKHNRHCQEELVSCPYKCLSLKDHRLLPVKRKEVENHLQDECDCRPYQCEHCGHEDSYRRITGREVFNVFERYCKHYDQCSEFPLECPNKCGTKDIKRKDMEDHRSQCPEEPVQCPFEEAGCKEKLVRRELEQHTLTLEQLQKHLLMVMGAYKETKQTHKETQKTNETLKEANEEVKQDLQKTKKELDETTTNDQLQDAHKELCTSCCACFLARVIAFLL